MYLIYLLHVRPIPGLVHNSTMHHISQVKWVANNVMLTWNPYIISQSKECMKKHCFTFIWCSLLFLSLMDSHVLSTLNCTVQTSRDLLCKQAISLPTPIAGVSSLPGERSGPWISIHFLSLRKDQGRMGHGRVGGIFIEVCWNTKRKEEKQVTKAWRTGATKWTAGIQTETIYPEYAVTFYTILIIIICAGSFLDHCQFYFLTTAWWTTGTSQY